MEAPQNLSLAKSGGGDQKNPSRPPKKSKKSNRDGGAKRFSDEQIKSLESIFEVDTKLEPRKKLEVATDLGLHPRQVAIWFQNRRARWKSKQIEHDYKKLKSNYDNLYSQFDELMREKHSLQMQLQELSGLMKNLEKVDISRNINAGPEGNHNFNSGSSDRERIIGGNDFNFADEDEEKFNKYLEDEEVDEVRRWGEDDQGEVSDHWASPETWRNLSSGGLFHQSSGPSEWWDN